MGLTLFLFSMFEIYHIFQPCLLTIQHLSLHCQLLHLSSDNSLFLQPGTLHKIEVLVSRSVVHSCFGQSVLIPFHFNVAYHQWANGKRHRHPNA